MKCMHISCSVDMPKVMGTEECMELYTQCVFRRSPLLIVIYSFGQQQIKREGDKEARGSQVMGWR